MINPSWDKVLKTKIIPAATENDSCIRWYKGRDCGPRSEQGIVAKAAPVVNEGPAGAVRQGRTGVRHKTAKKVSTFLAVGIRNFDQKFRQYGPPHSHRFLTHPPSIQTASLNLLSVS